MKRFEVIATVDGKKRIQIVRAASRFAARQLALWWGDTVHIISIESI